MFERDNRIVTLTPAGRRFADFASESLRLWQEVKDELGGGGQNLRGELTLYCSVTACYSILPDVLTKFRKQYPEIHIKLRTGEVAMGITNVQEGIVDIAVAAKPDSIPSNLVFREIKKTPLLFIVPSKDWHYSGVDADEIPWDKVPMILPERELARRRVDLWFREKGIVPNIYAEAEGNEAILAMVNLGCGVGIIPGLVFEKRPFEVNVSPINVKPPLEPYSVGICVQKRRLSSPLIKAFWDIV